MSFNMVMLNNESSWIPKYLLFCFVTTNYSPYFPYRQVADITIKKILDLYHSNTYSMVTEHNNSRITHSHSSSNYLPIYFSTQDYAWIVLFAYNFPSYCVEWTIHCWHYLESDYNYQFSKLISTFTIFSVPSYKLLIKLVLHITLPGHIAHSHFLSPLWECKWP